MSGLLVALVGPDGAGKSTVCAAVVDSLRRQGQPASSIYMGVSAASADRSLPTTRLALRLKRARGASPDAAGPLLAADVARARGPRSLKGHVRAALRLANRAAEEVQREARVRWRLRGGQIVVVDRHYLLDYHATDVTAQGLSWDRRLHGWWLRHALRYPQLVVHLKAPAEVLFARKGEGSVEVLAQRQLEYESLADVVPRFERVRVDQPLEDTVEEVLDLIWDARHG